MTNTQIPNPMRPPLSADAAFVVHLTAIATESPESVCGRVEHVLSGNATRFASVAELLGFMRQVLAVAGVLAVLVALPPPAWSRTNATCLTGDDPSVANDAAQIAALRGVIDGACPCASFDGSKGNAHVDYVRCAKGEIAAAVDQGELRPKCKARVRAALARSTCGWQAEKQGVPCIETGVRGKIRCLVVPAAQCASKPERYERVACQDHVYCVDAGDENADYLVNALDSGACIPTPSPTPADTATSTPALTSSPTSTPTSTPMNTATETPTAVPSDTATLAPTATEPPTATPTATPTDTPTGTPTATPTGEPSWTSCADENDACVFPGSGYVRYGANGTYQIQYFIQPSVPCNNATFGDPAPFEPKHCDYNVTDVIPTTTPLPTQTPASTATPTSTPNACVGGSGIVPRVDVNNIFLDDPQTPVPGDPEVLVCGPPGLGGGGCQLNPLESSIGNFFDASASVDLARCPGDPAPSFHWEIFFPPQVSGGGYSSAGITGYRASALTIRPISLPTLAENTDALWRVRLTITSNVTGQTSESWFSFVYQTTWSMAAYTVCQTQPALCASGGENLRPATEPI